VWLSGKNRPLTLARGPLPAQAEIGNDLLKLSERIYYCDKCGFSISRDLNAAINIEREGIRVLADFKVDLSTGG